MKQENWVLELRNKISQTRKKMIGICAILWVILAIILMGCLGIEGLLCSLPFVLVLFSVFLLSLCLKLKTRYHNGNTIVLYCGLSRNRLYINGDFFDETGIFSNDDCYGQLPTGEEVIAKTDFWGQATIYIGNTSNNQGINIH